MSRGCEDYDYGFCADSVGRRNVTSEISYMKYEIGKFMDKEKGKQSWEK